jgi:hypothetical protein
LIGQRLVASIAFAATAPAAARGWLISDFS